MTKAGFTINRVGHVGINVTNMDRSLEWYLGVLGMTLTGRWPWGPNGEMSFIRFTDDHHNMVLFTHRTEVDPNAQGAYLPLQHIALEIENRDEWLVALAELQRKGIEILNGPLVHGFEGGNGRGTLIGGSGSRSFYVADPDGNSVELYTDMMKVPDGEQFPRENYADLVERVKAQRAAAAASS
jgi:catechol 2,3-dioxygenase-like lactoylglutathione lyase family enzyme